MSEYNEGDRLRAEKGETVIEGKAWNDCSGAVMIGSSGWSVERLIKIGFTLTVIEKAKPKLPTEPSAIYSVIKFRSRIPAMLHEDRLWYFVGYPGYMRAGGQQRGQTWEELITACGTNFEILAVQS